ncbi:MAG: N-acetyltransferase [Burkholderiaceae bacterium]|nr:N-acetyltransferase [Burkholderiaceae bacterium]
MTKPTAIEHLPERGRFQTVVDGRTCVCDYRLAGGVMEIVHTGVPGAVEGRGIAGELVAAALAHARANGWKVRPVCSYVQAYMRRHAETQDLLA